MTTVQDLFTQDLLRPAEEGTNETTELLGFISKNATPLTKSQIESFLLLSENGLFDIANFTNELREKTVPIDVYHQTINKLTLADRIRGNAKLSQLLKANANPTASALNPNDVKAKPLREKELD